MQACGADGFRRHASPRRGRAHGDVFRVAPKCTRHRYSCFNPNQEDYEFSARIRAISRLSCARRTPRGAQFDCLAITGGEPCLHKPEVLEFCAARKSSYPDVHVRIYTSGDLLDDAFLAELASAGLDELRFSVKPQETDGAQEALFERMAAAVRVIPDVMAEMPVMPGEEEEMRALLVRLDSLGCAASTCSSCASRCITSASSGAAASAAPQALQGAVQLLVCGRFAPLPAARSRASICCASPKRRGFRWACITARWTTRTRGRCSSRIAAFCSTMDSRIRMRGSLWTARITS